MPHQIQCLMQWVVQRGLMVVEFWHSDITVITDSDINISTNGGIDHPP